jgi:hypothetical protein
MAKTLVIHPERCTACRACELACSMKHHGEFNPSRSRIQVNVFLDDALLVGPGVNPEAGILHNLNRTRPAFTVRPDQLVARAITWGRILRDNRLAGAVGHLQ